MRFHTLRDRILNNTVIRKRLQIICLRYLLSLSVETRKHSLTFASELSGIGKASFCKFLKNNHNIIAYTSEDLSKREAKRFSGIISATESLPWKIFIPIDSTLQSRSSLKTENVQRFNHGQGYVIGHQRTNILLIFNGIIIPLRPIPFYSRKYCRRNIRQAYKTEHKKVIAYINKLNLNDYLISHENCEVAVLTDSGYDDKNIQNAVLKKGRHFIGALKSSRSIKTEKNGEVVRMGQDSRFFQEKPQDKMGNRPYFYGRSEKKAEGFPRKTCRRFSQRSRESESGMFGI